MRLPTDSIRSKVARRVFTLFLIAAIAPTLTLGYFAFRQVNTQINGQIAQALHAESKLLGMSVLERLGVTANQLRWFRDHLDDAPNGGYRSSAAEATETGDANLRSIRVASLETVPNLAIDEERLAHLRKGGTLLSLRRDTDGTPHLLLYMLIDPQEPAEGVLTGEVDVAGMFDFQQDAGAILCVLDASGTVVLCSAPDAQPAAAAIPPRTATGHAGWFDWTLRGESYRAAYWNLFLKPQFHAGTWTILISKPTAAVRAGADEFKRIFLPVILLSLVLVTLLSLIQIRRLLVPLEKLRSAAGKIAAKQFKSCTVDIRSGDEFEELGHAFNGMALRLDKQFGALAAMAEIDRTILSALDKDYVIEILLTRLYQVIACDIVAVAVIDDHAAPNARIVLGGPGRPTEAVDDLIALTSTELTQLAADDGFVVAAGGPSAPSYLTPLRQCGAAHCWTFPIKRQQTLAGFIVLGYRKPPALADDDLTQARDLADRAAVALTNVAWQEKLYHQTHYDRLTDLPNRMLLRDRLDQALLRAAREHAQVALLFIDLDRFKLVNDSLGHRAGDELLIQVADRMRACVRDTDTVARLGGDEFTVVIADVDPHKDLYEVTTSITEKIFSELAAAFRIADQEVFVGTSIGIAVYPKDADNIDDLLRHADSAMYHAKAQGRNNFQFYSPPHNEKTLKRLTLETALRRAVERDELRLHYQPQVMSADRKLVGTEALLRWEHPEKGVISPADFIPLAEEAGLIIPIGEWVLQTVCAQAMQWQRQGLPGVRIAINLSARQFQDPRLCKRVRDVLSASGLSARYLELEITEGATMDNPARTKTMLQELKALGLRISIDDFGTGYSSLSYLRQFPIDTLKVDQSFVRSLPGDRDSAAIATAIIALAQSLHLNVVAEGVETEAQLEFLRAHQCDEIQGYLISEPLPADEFSSRFLNAGAEPPSPFCDAQTEYNT